MTSGIREQFIRELSPYLQVYSLDGITRRFNVLGRNKEPSLSAAIRDVILRIVGEEHFNSLRTVVFEEGICYSHQVVKKWKRKEISDEVLLDTLGISKEFLDGEREYLLS